MWDFTRLFLKHSREINRFLQRRGHSPETAADLTQETFLRVIAASPADAAINANSRAYLYRVSRNLSINHSRREAIVSITTDEDALNESIDPSPSVETIVYDHQRLKRTVAALEGLPARTRKAFELHRLGGRTINEIGEELGVSCTTAWALIHEAYRHLVKETSEF